MTQWDNSNIFITTRDSGRYNVIEIDRYNSLFSPLRPNVYNVIANNSEFNTLKVVIIDSVGDIKTSIGDNKVAYNIGEISNEDFLSMGFRDMSRT